MASENCDQMNCCSGLFLMTKVKIPYMVIINNVFMIGLELIRTFFVPQNAISMIR